MLSAVRAAVVPRPGPAEVIEVRTDWPEPDPPGPGEVLIAVEAAGLNPSDTKIRASGGGGQVKPPYVSGREAAGRVLEVGPGVDGITPGEAVFAFFGWGARPGGHTERLVVAASAVARRPAGVPLPEAAGLPLAGLTARQALDALDPPPGERVLVTSGSGGVGHLAVQLAAIRGLEVIATAGSANRAFVESLGASEVLDYRDPATPARVAGVRYVIDSVGPDNIELLQDHLAPDAHIAVVAGAPREARPGQRVTPIRCQADSGRLAELASLMESGRLAVTVQEVFPLETVAEAHRLLEGRHVRGKLVIAVVG